MGKYTPLQPEAVSSFVQLAVAAHLQNVTDLNLAKSHLGKTESTHDTMNVDMDLDLDLDLDMDVDVDVDVIPSSSAGGYLAVKGSVNDNISIGLPLDASLKLKPFSPLQVQCI
ncbi:hypothetical protein EKO04_008872 [Ascochyta lentis]|uniref:Uncharacterized protein n=1 Tax=Ascochyta lentis TaxID=205686 RepID=A0A8H7MFP8_9PLEO|nr:hypothetical protein EKO04_008872 [Ascochyta lentis]